MIGDELAVRNQVHIKDLARSYVTLLHWLEENPAPTVAENPYVFCENGEELSWRVCGGNWPDPAKRRQGRRSDPANYPTG